MLPSYTNYKTTLTGIAAIAGAIAHLAMHLSTGDTGTLAVDFAAIMAGWTGILAKDSTAK